MEKEEFVEKIINLLDGLSPKKGAEIIRYALEKLKTIYPVFDDVIVTENITCHAFSKDKFIKNSIFDNTPFDCKNIDGCYALKNNSLSVIHNIPSINKTNSIINIANN